MVDIDNGPDTLGRVAIIGLAGRFPGAADVEQLWRNLCRGAESITPFTDAELLAAGVPAGDLANPRYVRAGAVLDGIELFDAGFFGIPPREAQLLDPQQRLFLESAWAALESAGCDPSRYDGSVGVFAGSALSTYLLHNLLGNEAVRSWASPLQVVLGNDKDSLATTTAFNLDLRGPAFNVQSYCSTSLVAVAAACTSLVAGECDVALAGGSAVSVPQRVGYVYQEGGIASPDGRCRAFDADAQGAPLGSGVGVVVLKRLGEALADGDHVHAVIRGWAVNNDGALKVGYTAPGVRGQSAVITEAVANAGVDPATIDFIEAHGTGTALGDAAEIAALGKAFAGVDRPGGTALGSVKTNLGHLDRAAGVTGLIKAALAIEHGVIPPTVNFRTPSPQLTVPGSPFRIPTALEDWPRHDHPRRAGVSAFGIGGTNAHLVLEQAADPPVVESPHRQRPQLIVLSARTDAAADARVAELAEHLRALPDLDLADVAHTLQTGRREFEHRRALVAQDVADALAGLTDQRSQRVLNAADTARGSGIGLVIAGVGEQYPGMAAGLYAAEPVFAAVVDECAGVLNPLLGLDLREALFGDGQSRTTTTRTDIASLLGRAAPVDAPDPLAATALAQPGVFVVEYALAKLLESWGIRPDAMVGYSLGEYVAAALAGVLTLPDALRLVAHRAAMIDRLPRGAMTAVSAAPGEVLQVLPAEVQLAAVSSSQLCVVSGPVGAVEQVEAMLGARGVALRRLGTTHAFHSQMLQPAAAELTDWVATHVTLSAPELPYLSNVTGTWISPDQAQDPAYWAAHMCGQVRFADSVGELLADQDRVIVEIGPGQSLSSLVRAHPQCGTHRMGRVIPTLPGRHDSNSDLATAHTALARLWLAGLSVDWAAYREQAPDRSPRRVPLPTYPFERQRYWIDPARPDRAASCMAASSSGPGIPVPAAETPRRDVGSWLRQPQWKPADAAGPGPGPGPFLVLAGQHGPGGRLGVDLAGALATRGQCITVTTGEQYAELASNSFQVRAAHAADYERLFTALAERGCAPAAIAHLWGVGEDDRLGRHGYHSLTGLARGLAAALPQNPVHLLVVTDRMQLVDGTEAILPEKSAVLGPCLVLPQEYPTLSCTSVDLDPPLGPAVVALLERELAGPAGAAVAIRGARRLVQSWRPLPAPAGRAEGHGPPLRDGGTYLLTGGLGNVGLLIAAHIARRVRRPHLILTGRSGLPARAEWDDLIGAPASAPSHQRTVQRIRSVLDLEEQGAEVLVLTADATDQSDMASVVRAAREWAGPIHGVIHGTGLTSVTDFQPVADMNEDVAEAHFVAKADSLLALERALGEEPLDFCVLQSSISSVLGGLGFSAYAGANAVLDAAAARARRSGRAWVSINWDTWQTSDSPASTGLGASMAANSMTVEEGLEALDRALVSAVERVVVSVGDLPSRLDQWVGGRLTAAPDPLGDPFPRPDLPVPYAAPRSALERRLAELWCETLGLDRVGVNDNFFDLGGNSLIGLQLVRRVSDEHGTALPAVVLFAAPTIRALAAHLGAETEAATQEGPDSPDLWASNDRDIAVIGMAGRFPGARDVDAFWQNLRDGVESISWFTDEELFASGVDATTVSASDYVKARPVIEGVQDFDAAFFGYSPREAELTDPQQRLFLECSWHALENAGYAPRSCPGSVGVFGGTNISTYLRRLYESGELDADVSDYQAVIGNDKDALTTAVSYRLDLTGPSLAVQTFCSTSLVAVHLAVGSLRGGECDLALAGGVSIRVPDKVGHRYTPGGMESPDGHVRPFDARSRGSMFGDGAGVVVLKRLAEALADGDTVHAVIRGSAVNNDGSLKVGFTAPSVAGQSAVVSRALRDAGVTADTVSYVEAHGTGTPLGDPIEVASLTRAFGAAPSRGSCPLGSVKSNVGHLDRAAGVSGLIKTVLSLEHAEIPATLHFEAPNPEIDFAGSPFYVNDRLAPWPARPGLPRRAGVNSLGMGGTNVHVVVEEAPAMPPTTAGRRVQLVPLSARSERALAEAAADLAAHLGRHPDTDLADVAFTLQTGREAFHHRRLVTCADVAGLVAALREPGTSEQVVDGEEPEIHVHLVDRAPDRDVLAALSAAEPTFAAAAAECELALASGAGDIEANTALVFVAQYATIRLLRSWGVPVTAVTGDGVGAYAAAAASEAVPVSEAISLLRAGQPAPVAPPDESGSRITADIGPGTAATSDPSPTSTHLDAADSLHHLLGRLWLAGVPVDWTRYHSGERRRRTPLPGYPFQRERFWIDAPAVTRNGNQHPGVARLGLDSCSASRTGTQVAVSGVNDPRELLSALPRRTVDDWFYLPGWGQTAPPLPDGPPSDGGWVVFADDGGIADQLVARLVGRGASAVRVGVGDRFTRTPDGGYLLRPDSAADFEQLVIELDRVPGSMRHLVHLWALDDPAEPQAISRFMRERGYTSLVWLAQALGGAPGPHDLVVVSTATQDVTGLDEVDPERSVVTGPCRVIPLEFSGVTCRQVDVARPREVNAVAAIAEQVLRECVAAPSESLVVWRAGRRWVPDYQPLPLASLDGDLRPLRDRGVYLVTGGLGGVGLSIGRGLARTVSARLVLLSRTGVPPRDEWPGLLSHPETAPTVRARIEAVLELERLGAEVLVCAADVADPIGVAAVFDEARARFGAVHGVVHAAGVPGMGLLQFRTAENVCEAMTPKVDGTRVLRDQLSAAPLDFLVLFSSITAITGGGPGQADYCSANAYLDAFADAAAQTGPDDHRVVSIGWGEWQWNAWAQGLSGYAPDARAFFEENRRQFGISYDEGWQVFLRVLRSGQPRVVVSTQDFAEIVRLSPQFSVAKVLELGAGVRVKHPRPVLGTPFVAPGTEPERLIADLWADALGLADVGVHDNFFELGGNSLLGVSLVARLCQQLGHPGLPPHVLYLAPTVRELAQVASGSDQREWVDDRRERGSMRREGMRRRRSG